MAAKLVCERVALPPRCGMAPFRGFGLFPYNQDASWPFFVYVSSFESFLKEPLIFIDSNATIFFIGCLNNHACFISG